MTNPIPTAIVTGAASGIGHATALKLAGNGYRVFGCDISCSESAIESLKAAKVDHQQADVTRADHIENLVNHALQQTGRIDVLVNNAGVGLVRQIADVSEAEWDHVFDTNLKAAFLTSRLVIPVMAAQESGGSIVNVASNAGLLPRSHDPVYSTSKMALVGFTKSLALCHSVDRIRVNCVCPGPVENTHMIEENFEGRTDRQQVVRELISASPLARAWDRMIIPEEVANAILYLCSNGARMVSGTAIAIDGGKSLGVPPACDDAIHAD